MTKEEIEEIIKLANASRPQVNQTMNFNAPIGQQIAHVDKIEAHFDKNMGMQIANADECVKDGLLVDGTDSPTEAFPDILPENIIFNHRIFNTNARVERLRDEIGARIKGARLAHPEIYGDERPQIDPGKKNEWYYIWKMLGESALLKRNATVRDFIRQMMGWYPEVLEDMVDEDERKAFISRMEKSISAEKKLWSKAGQEIPFKDMNFAWKEQGIDHKKFQPMFLVCRDLRHALQNLKSAIEQEAAARDVR